MYYQGVLLDPNASSSKTHKQLAGQVLPKREQILNPFPPQTPSPSQEVAAAPNLPRYKSNVPISSSPRNPIWCQRGGETPTILTIAVTFSIMSYLSKVIPLVRARSSSPILYNPIFYPTTAGCARTPPLRSISPLAATLSSGSDHGLIGGYRGYATAFAGPCDGLWTTNDVGAIRGRGTRASLTRAMSDVVLPDPPTSNHPHKPIPGVTGKLIYTET